MFRLMLAIGAIVALAVTIEVAVEANRSTGIRFEDITPRSGIDFVTDSSPTPNKNQPETMISGVGLIDYDNDGYPDIFLINGAAIPSLKKDSPKYYNNDGKLDLFLSNYCQWEVNKDPVCLSGGRLRAYCHPKFYEPLPSTLYRNNGDGTFTDVSEETGITKKFGKGMGVGFNDYDGDGFLDIFVANDNMPNSLFHNLKGKAFEEVAMDAGVAYSENGKAVSGMGAEFRDLDNDGLPDIWHTATELETFPLFHNRGSGIFIDVTGRSGLARPTLEMSGWSNGVADFDNDGWKDLFVARGNVLDNVAEFTNRTYAEPNSIFRNLGKMRFEDVTALAVPDMQVAEPYRGAVIGDLFNDGHLDLVFTVLQGRARVLGDVTSNGNHWVTFQLVGPKSNRMGIGAQLKVTTEDGDSQYDMVSTSAGYGASRDPRAHFGLGPSKTVKQLLVRWPSGVRQGLKDLPADQIHRIVEP